MITINLLSIAHDVTIFVTGIFVGVLLATATADFVKRAVLDWLDHKATSGEKWK